MIGVTCFHCGFAAEHVVPIILKHGILLEDPDGPDADAKAKKVGLLIKR
jgi:hypothetical protein